MDFAASFDDLTRNAGLDFVVIGGQAVGAWGVQRETIDVDIVIDKMKREEWIECLKELEFTVLHDGGTFLQFASGRLPTWPLDLMLVPAETFKKLFDASEFRELFDRKFRIPALLHLVALKLHALKQGLAHRRIRDFLDVVELLQVNDRDPRSLEVKAIFEQFGTEELYEQIVHACQ
jgi:hypothetical protein